VAELWRQRHFQDGGREPIRQFCSHRRHGQNKTVLSCPCRRCELGIVVWLVVAALFPNCALIGLIVSEMARFFHVSILVLRCLFIATFLGRVVGYISSNDITCCPNHEKESLWQKHVVWTIKRENRSDGSTLARDRKIYRTKQWKSHKRVIFHLLWTKSHLANFHLHLHSDCNDYMCKNLNWNF